MKSLILAGAPARICSITRLIKKVMRKTIISTNFGNNGNAHSEYLGPLSEQGIIGLGIVLALLFSTLSLGIGYVIPLKIVIPAFNLLVLFWAYSLILFTVF